MKPRNAAVESLLAEVRRELLAPPSESRAAEHVAMMRLEDQIYAPAPPVSSQSSPGRSAAGHSQLGIRTRGGAVRATASRPRRFAALFAAICVLSGSVGVDAASALPAAVRQVTDHITDAIVHTFGVPQPSDPRSEGPPIRAAEPFGSGRTATSVDTGSRVPAGARGSGPSAPAGRAAGVDAQGPRPSDSPAVSPGDPSDPPSAPQPPTGSPRPPKLNMKKDPDTPPGLPANWRSIAVAAARAHLVACTRVTDIMPLGCPQVAAIDPAEHPGSLHWVLLNQPLAGATTTLDAIVSTHPLISVYGLFQMEATYTARDGTQRFAYSSGVAQAIMMLSGSAPLYVTFASGSAADHLPAGVHVPSFEAPAGVSDAAVLASVQAGFAAWVTGSGGGTLVGDPTQGALVSFDPAHGNFTVSGMYTVAPSDGTVPVSHGYTASLLWNGDVVQLLTIAGA